MRSPTKRAPTRKARGYAASVQAKGSTPSSATNSGAQALAVAPLSALNDGLGTHDQPSSRDYRVGDTVLVSTAGKPAQEATVVAVDASNGFRFNVLFKDKRRKGGWRDHHELSPLFLPRTGTLARTPCAATPPALGAPARDASGESDDTAAGPMHPQQGNKDGPENAAARFPRSPSIAERDPSPAQGQRSTTAACASSLPAQEPSKEIDNALQPGPVQVAAMAVHALDIGDRGIVSLNAGSPCNVEAKVVRVDNSRTPAMFKLRIKGSGNKEVWRAAADVVPIGLPPQTRGQNVTEEAAPRPTLHQPPTTTAAAQEPATKVADTHQPGIAATAAVVPAAAVAVVHEFAVGDRVLVSLDAGSPCSTEAKVVRVDNSRTPAMFRIRLKGRGKKEIWRAAADVVPAIRLPQEGGKGATGKEARGRGVSESDATTTSVAKTLPDTDPSSKGRPKAGGRKAGRKTNTKQRICPPLGDASAGEAIGGAAPTPDSQGGKSKVTHKPTDDGEGSAMPLAGERLDSQSTSSAHGSPAVGPTEPLATGPRSHGRRGGASNSARPAPEEEPGRAGVETETGARDIGREKRQRQHQQLRQQQQEKQQKQKQQRKQQQQQKQQQKQQQRGEQPTIDASVVVPVGSVSSGQEATVIEAQTAEPPSVGDSTQDRRTNGVRKTAEKIPSTTDVSVSTDQEGGGDGPEQGQACKSPTPSGNAEKTAQRAPGKTLPRIRQDGAAGGGDGVGTGAKAVRNIRGGDLGDYWQDPPPRKRAAATAAASAMSSSRTRGVAGRRDGRESDSATKNALASKGKGATKRTPAGKVIRTPRKFGQGLQQRPKVVTPGSAQGRSEPALRTTHPTKAIPRLKQFKVQEARLARKARNNRAPPSESTATITPTTHRLELTRPLGQPIHSLEDEQRGIGGNNGQSSGGGHDDGSDVRRGRRTRKQVHPSLSEDMISASFCDVEDEDYGIGGNEEGGSGDSGGGDAPLRFRRSGDAPWGSGDKPLIKVRLSLLKGGAPLNAQRSALAVVTFALDRHRYSGEQLANVLTAEGILCYSDETTRVFVLTQSKEADQKEMLKRVQNLALNRCGAKVEVAPWLAGRLALDEFLDNHRRVLDLIIRHRLAGGMWSEVNGVFFNALFCGRRAKRTFNGVRLGVNLAASHNGALETGVWELWVTVEPVVHRFSPVDWWALIQEKEEKGLRDFSGSASDDLEERLQVVCLPKLSRGVVYDVKEDAFEMDRLQEANLKRGYLVGPRSEDEMVEYWRQVHHISLPSSNFVFVKVRIGGMVLTYPSWCVVRAQADVPDAARAMRGRILDAFTDAVDAMEGMTVMETTFSWNMLSGGGRGGGMCGDAPAFVTANGRAVGWNKKHAPASCAGAFDGNSDGTCNDNGDDGGDVSAAPSQTHGKPFRNTTTIAGLCTPGPTGVDAETGGGTNGGCGGRGREGEDVRRGSTPAPVVTPHTMSAPPCHPGTPSSGSVSLATGEGRRADPRAASPETRAAQAAAQASLSVIRQSIIRRRGGMPNRAPPPPPVVGQDGTGAAAAGAEAEPLSDTRLCATPFVIRRPPSSSSSVPRPASFARPASTPGAGAKGGPLDLTRAGADGSGGRDIGHGEALTEKEPGSAPDTPAAAGRGNPAAQLVTPATGDMTGGGAATGVAAKTGAAAGLKRRRASNARGGLGGKAPKRGKDGAVAGGPAAAEYGGKEGHPRAGIPRGDAGGSKKLSEAASVDGDGAAPTAAEATAAAAVAVAATAAEPPSAPTKIVVTFSAAGSLGMGVAKDVTEEGSVILAGKAPTSAAAVVPNGWRLTEVDGKSARGLGDETIAGLLSTRPVDVTFEALPEPESEPSATAAPTAPAVPAAAPAAAAPRKRAPAKPKATKGKKAPKAKKAPKVTTVRKAFKVQSRGPGGGQEKAGSGGGGGGGGAGGGGGGAGAAAPAYTVPTLPASTTTAAI